MILGCDAHQPEDAWDPETEARALKEFVTKFGLRLVEQIKNCPPLS